MQIRENVPISSLTTMRLGGDARYVLDLEQPEDIPTAYDFATQQHLSTWVMGGGANTIGHDEGFDGVILHNCLKGIEIIRQNDEQLILKSMGGEIWDDLVKFACEQGYSGIEALSMIPGTAGAAPVQNIGAYGQEVSQVLESVEAYDAQTQQFVELTPVEMNLGYRHSRFNHGEDVGRFFITSITIKLRRQHLQPPFYNSLQRYIDEHQVTDFSPLNIRKIVSKIRATKLPDPEFVASSGSFFKNVIVDADQIDAMVAQNIPLWRNPDGTGKLNSAWLIEQCGFKGKIFRGMRVSNQAPLVLINESAKSYADLAAARAEIVGAVAEKYGVVLEQEPVEIQSPDQESAKAQTPQPKPTETHDKEN